MVRTASFGAAVITDVLTTSATSPRPMIRRRPNLSASAPGEKRIVALLKVMSGIRKNVKYNCNTAYLKCLGA